MRAVVTGVVLVLQQPDVLQREAEEASEPRRRSALTGPGGSTNAPCPGLTPVRGHGHGHTRFRTPGVASGRLTCTPVLRRCSPSLSTTPGLPHLVCERKTHLCVSHTQAPKKSGQISDSSLLYMPSTTPYHLGENQMLTNYTYPDYQLHSDLRHTKRFFKKGLKTSLSKEKTRPASHCTDANRLALSAWNTQLHCVWQSISDV